MSYIAHIRKNATGEVRQYRMEVDWDDESSEWWWTEGNYGCDCNRQLCFERASGEREPNDIEGVTCGETAYTVTQIELSDGRVIVIVARGE